MKVVRHCLTSCIENTLSSRALGILGRVRVRAKVSLILHTILRRVAGSKLSPRRYLLRHESGCLARVSWPKAVYEIRLTAARVTELDDGCFACALVYESRARCLTGWKAVQ